MQPITQNPFVNVPPTAEGHFLLHFYAMVARLLAHLYAAGMGEKEDNHFRQFSFLAGYQAALRTYYSTEPTGQSPAMEGAWWDTHIADWESHHAGHLPLWALIDELGLDADAVRLLIAVG